jgi:hypothetical protein
MRATCIRSFRQGSLWSQTEGIPECSNLLNLYKSSHSKTKTFLFLDDFIVICNKLLMIREAGVPILFKYPNFLKRKYNLSMICYFVGYEH